MSWRVVVVSSRSKLDYKMGFMVVRSEEGERRIHLGDISVLILETTAVSITAYLLMELNERKIKVIFCDNQHNPAAEMIPMYGNYVSSGRIKSQIKWDEEIKGRVWQNITRAKIGNQAWALRKAGLPEKAEQLMEFAAAVKPGDPTNREGHAAKVYFNALFGMKFYRDQADVRNAILDYGYAILLACFNREIAAAGYLTQIGIWHDSAENAFNLGCDLMESFRPLVDVFALRSGFKEFEKDEKMATVNVLNSKIGINNTEQYLNNAIGIYAHSVFNALESGEVDKILNWYEL